MKDRKQIFASDIPGMIDRFGPTKICVGIIDYRGVMLETHQFIYNWAIENGVVIMDTMWFRYPNTEGYDILVTYKPMPK